MEWEVLSGTASWQNHNGVRSVFLGISEHLGSRTVLIGPYHPRANQPDGIWLPSRRYSRPDDYFDALLRDDETDQMLKEALSHVEIVHLHSGSVLTYRVLRVIETMATRPKVIVHVHTHYIDYCLVRFGPVKGYFASRAVSQLYQYQARMADMIIFPSVWARNALGPDMGLSLDDPRVVIWSAPVQEYACSEQDAVISDDINGILVPSMRYLFYAGRLGKEKHIDEMIQLFGWIRTIDPHLALVISGFGNQSPFRKVAVKMGVGDWVYFTGQVSEGAVCAYSKGAVAAINSCPNDTQSLGSLRQMLCGLPLIAPANTVLADHIIESGGGVIFDGSRSCPSPKVMRELKLVLTKDEVRAQRGKLARQYVLDNFSPEGQYAALDAHYARLLTG